MVRVITQETYDEVVKENMEEFDMSPDEAVKEAVAQFEAQGVDLSNIIKDLALGSGDSHLVSDTVTKLKELCSYDKHDLNAVLKELDVLKSECNKDIARRVRAGKDGAYKILVDLMFTKQLLQQLGDRDVKLMINVLDTLTALMEMQPDLLDARGIDLIKTILDNVENDDVVAATLRWTTTCCIKHEMNRQKLFGQNIAENLKLLLNVSGNPKLLSETLHVIRKLTLDDDVRVEFGKAHEHARELGAQMLEPLTNLLKEHTKPPLVSELMLTIATLLVRHELCKMVADCDVGISAIFTALADNYDNCAVVQQANKLITALAGNDDVKRELVKGGIVPIVVSVLNRHSNNATATALTLKCIAALALREPEHSKQLYDSGAPDAIVECMKVHPDNASVQKNACWAIRNMVSRCREQNPKFKELGVEPILNGAYDKFGKEFGFDIKSALRDLECDVKLDEQWTGKGVQLDQ